MGRPGWPSFGVQPGNGNGRRGRPAGGGSRFRSSTGPREAYASQEKGRKEREKRFLQSKRCLPARALGRGGGGGVGATFRPRVRACLAGSSEISPPKTLAV